MNWVQLRLYIWKSYKAQRARKNLLFLELLIAIVISFLVSQFIRSSKQSANDLVILETYCLDRYYWKGVIAYSPQNPGLEAIIKDAFVGMKKIKILAFNNSDEMEDMMMQKMDQRENLFVGIAVENYPLEDESSKSFKDLTVTFIFPSQMERNPSVWHTHVMISERLMQYKIYQRRGFLHLQKHLVHAMVKHETKNDSITVPEICLKPFPTLEKFSRSTMRVVPHLLIIIFMIPCSKFADTLTHEKTSKHKIFLIISGLSKEVYLLAWFITMLFVFLMIIFLSLIVLFIPFKGLAALSGDCAGYMIIHMILTAFTCCAFSIMLSAIFNSAEMVENFVNIFWILTVLFVGCFLYEMPYIAKIMSCFLVILCSDLGFQLIFNMEGRDVGLWNGPFELGLVYIMLLIDFILYMALAIYIRNVRPGHHGVAKRWYYPYQMIFYSRKVAPTIKTPSQVHNDFVEYPKKGWPTAELYNVTKAFPEIYAVKKVSMEIYKNEVTVILGHNGSGKSVIIDLISGVMSPSAGSVSFTVSNPTIGLCPQQDLFMPDLTVKEHLYFFSRLRTGLKMAENSELIYLMTKLELTEMRMEMVKHLPVSAKKKLAVAIAMIGNPSIVLLDSPTTDLDHWSRKIIWDLIRIYKNDRTIVITTNSVIEAEFLGDRVAVFKSGMLKCYGSGPFLKMKFGSSFGLSLSVDSQCEEAKVTDLLRNYVPCASRNTFVGSELTYFLPERYVDQLEAMLKNLEEESENLHIQGYTISYGKLEELFTRMAENKEERLHKIIKVPITESFLNLIKQRIMANVNKSQFIAMLNKKCIESKRSWIVGIQLVVPFLVFFILLSFKTTEEEKHMPAIMLDMRHFNKTVTLVSGNNKLYKDHFSKMMIHEKVEHVKNIQSAAIKKLRKDPDTARYKMVIGAQLNKNKFVGWFNTYYLHTEAILMGILCNVYIKPHLGNDSNILFVNKPLYFTNDVTDEINEEKQEIKETVLKLIIGEGYTNVIVLFIVFCVKEASTKFKSLQLISGMNFKIFWVVNFLRDFLFSIIVVSLIILDLYIFKPRNFKSTEALTFVGLLMMSYALAGIPFMYVFSRLFHVPSSAYVMVELISLALTVTLNEVVKYLSEEQKTHLQQFVMVLFPFYGFQLGVYHLSHWQERIDECGKLKRKYDDPNEACKQNSMCCDLTYMSPKIYALRRPILTCICTSVVYFIILWVMELGFYINKSKEVPVIPLFALQPDVRKETIKIVNLQEEEIEQEYRVVLKNVSKYFSRSNAVVKNITFGMQSGEIFGLLGPNSCGKSTLLNMMTGDVKITYGQIYIMGLKMTDDRQKIRKLIGYGSQSNPLNWLFTPEELLLIFCRIRGFTVERGNFLSRKIAFDLDFYKSYRTRIGSLSPGTRKKVIFAMSIIGSPPIILLDEPTMGLDPSSEQLIWDQLIKLREKGHCIILSSNNARECEILCNRVAICIDGKIVALNTQHNLKKTFARGLRIVLNMAKSASPGDVDKTEQFMLTHITGKVLKERWGLILIYRLLDVEMTFSQIFHLIEEQKVMLKIDEYWLGHCSLNEVFMRFTEEHHDDRL